MLYTLIFSIIIAISINTLIIITPITIGLNILLISIITAALFSITNSSWISFLIFLIYIRGTLVIFSYFVAITPNKTISLPFHIPIIITSPIFLFILMHYSNFSNNYSSTIIQTNTFFSKQYTITLIIIALILLFTIVVVVKITSSNKKGPLRPFNYVQTVTNYPPSY